MNLSEIKSEALKAYALNHLNDLMGDGRTVEEWLKDYPLNRDNLLKEWQELLYGLNNTITLKDEWNIGNVTHALDPIISASKTYLQDIPLSLISFLIILSKDRGLINYSSDLKGDKYFLKLVLVNRGCKKHEFGCITYRFVYDPDQKGYRTYQFFNLNYGKGVGFVTGIHEPDLLSFYNFEHYLNLVLCLNAKTEDEFQKLVECV